MSKTTAASSTTSQTFCRPARAAPPPGTDAPYRSPEGFHTRRPFLQSGDPPRICRKKRRVSVSLRRARRSRSFGVVLKARLEHVAAFRAVAEGERGVRGVLGLGRVEAEKAFGAEDVRLVALYLDEESEGQLVNDDLRAREPPRLAPLLVDERGAVAERFEYRGERRGVRDLGLLLALALDGRARQVALLEGEDGARALATQTQHAQAGVEPRPRVDDVLLELRPCPALRARPDQPTPQRLILPRRQPV